VVRRRDADDFTVETGKTAQRTAVSDSVGTGRFGLAGAATFTAATVSVDLKFSAFPDSSADIRWGVLGRYVNTTRWWLPGSAARRANRISGCG
jgi:hypothetical protein